MAEDDFSRLVRDLGEVPKGMNKFLRTAIERSARSVKDAWKGRLKGSPSVRGGAHTVDYDVTTKRDSIEGEIGPNIQRYGGKTGKGGGQPSIVGMLEVGTPTTGPRGYGLAALHDTEADFEHGIEVAIDDALKAAGL